MKIPVAIFLLFVACEVIANSIKPFFMIIGIVIFGYACFYVGDKVKVLVELEILRLLRDHQPMFASEISFQSNGRIGKSDTHAYLFDMEERGLVQSEIEDVVVMKGIVPRRLWRITSTGEMLVMQYEAANGNNR